MECAYLSCLHKSKFKSPDPYSFPIEQPQARHRKIVSVTDWVTSFFVVDGSIATSIYPNVVDLKEFIRGGAIISAGVAW